MGSLKNIKPKITYMKTITPKEKVPVFKLGIEQLLSKTKKWISEIEFITDVGRINGFTHVGC